MPYRETSDGIEKSSLGTVWRKLSLRSLIIQYRGQVRLSIGCVGRTDALTQAKLTTRALTSDSDPKIATKDE